MLNEDEQRRFEEIGRKFVAEDPKTARELDAIESWLGRHDERPLLRRRRRADQPVEPFLPDNLDQSTQPIVFNRLGPRLTRIGGYGLAAAGALYLLYLGFMGGDQDPKINQTPTSTVPTSETRKAPQMPSGGVIVRLPITRG